jgi:hypothetical protein
VARKFTRFWIPLFPVKTRYMSVCAQCGLHLPWDKESAEAAVAQAAAAAPVLAGAEVLGRIEMDRLGRRRIV